jgi:hypothetical protein
VAHLNSCYRKRRRCYELAQPKKREAQLRLTGGDFDQQ